MGVISRAVVGTVVQLGLEEAVQGAGKGEGKEGDGEDGEGVGDWNVVQNNGMLPLLALPSLPSKK